MITIEAQDFVRQKKVNWKVWYFIDFTSFVLWLPCSLSWHIREASNLTLSIALSPLLQKRVNLVAMAAKELQNELCCLYRFFCLYTNLVTFNECCQNIPCKEITRNVQWILLTEIVEQQYNKNWRITIIWNI